MLVQNRFRSATLILALMLMVLAGYFLVISYVKYDKARNWEIALNNNNHLNAILSELVQERSITSMYLGSDKKEFIGILASQRIATDKVLELAKQNIVSDYVSALAVLFSEVSGLQKIRSDVDSGDSDFRDIFFEGYTKSFVGSVLRDVHQISDLKPIAIPSHYAKILNQLTVAQENTTVGRDYVAYFISSKKAMTNDNKKIWSWYRDQISRADYALSEEKKLQEMLDFELNSRESKIIKEKIKESSERIMAVAESDQYEEDLANWFTLNTKRISLLSKASKSITEQAKESVQTSVDREHPRVIISLVVLLASLSLVVLLIVGTRRSRKD